MPDTSRPHETMSQNQNQNQNHQDRGSGVGATWSTNRRTWAITYAWGGNGLPLKVNPILISQLLTQCQWVSDAERQRQARAVGQSRRPSSPGYGFASSGRRTHGEDQNEILIFMKSRLKPWNPLLQRSDSITGIYVNPNPQCLEKQVNPKGNQP